MELILYLTLFVTANLFGCFRPIPFTNISPFTSPIERIFGAIQLTCTPPVLRLIHPYVFPESLLDSWPDTASEVPIPQATGHDDIMVKMVEMYTKSQNMTTPPASQPTTSASQRMTSAGNSARIPSISDLMIKNIYPDFSFFNSTENIVFALWAAYLFFAVMAILWKYFAEPWYMQRNQHMEPTSRHKEQIKTLIELFKELKDLLQRPNAPGMSTSNVEQPGQRRSASGFSNMQPYIAAQEDISNRLFQLESDVDSFPDTVNQFSGDYLQAQIEELKSQLSELNQISVLRQTMDANILSCKEDMKELRQNFKSIESKESSDQTNFQSSVNEQFQRLEKRIDALDTAASSGSADSTQITKELSDLRAELNDLTTKFDDMDTKLGASASTEQLEELKSSQDSRNESIQRMDERIGTIDSKLSTSLQSQDFKQKATSMDKNKLPDFFRTELNNLRSQLNSIDTQLRDFATVRQLEELKSSHDSRNESIQLMDNKIDSMEKKLDEKLDGKLATIPRSQGLKQDGFDNIVSQINSLRAKLSDVEGKAQMHESNLTTTEHVVSEQQKVIDDLSKTAKTSQIENKVNRTKTASEIKDLLSKLKEVEEKLRSTQQSISDQQKAINELNNGRGNAEETAMADEQYKDFEKRCAINVRELEVCRERVNEYSYRLMALEEQMPFIKNIQIHDSTELGRLRDIFGLEYTIDGGPRDSKELERVQSTLRQLLAFDGKDKDFNNQGQNGSSSTKDQKDEKPGTSSAATISPPPNPTKSDKQPTTTDQPMSPTNKNQQDAPFFNKPIPTGPRAQTNLFANALRNNRTPTGPRAGIYTPPHSAAGRSVPAGPESPRNTPPSSAAGRSSGKSTRRPVGASPPVTGETADWSKFSVETEGRERREREQQMAEIDKQIKEGKYQAPSLPDMTVKWKPLKQSEQSGSGLQNGDQGAEKEDMEKGEKPQQAADDASAKWMMDSRYAPKELPKDDSSAVTKPGKAKPEAGKQEEDKQEEGKPEEAEQAKPRKPVKGMESSRYAQPEPPQNQQSESSDNDNKPTYDNSTSKPTSATTEESKPAEQAPAPGIGGSTLEKPDQSPNPSSQQNKGDEIDLKPSEPGILNWADDEDDEPETPKEPPTEAPTESQNESTNESPSPGLEESKWASSEPSSTAPSTTTPSSTAQRGRRSNARSRGLYTPPGRRSSGSDRGGKK